MPKTTERQQVRVDLSALAELLRVAPFVLALQKDHGTSAGGRVPSLDDVCSECAFELRPAEWTPTFAYIMTEEVTYTVKEGKRVHVSEHKQSVYQIVHHCPRHQHEVDPYSRVGAVPTPGSAPYAGFESVSVR